MHCVKATYKNLNKVVQSFNFLIFYYKTHET